MSGTPKSSVAPSVELGNVVEDMEFTCIVTGTREEIEHALNTLNNMNNYRQTHQ